MSEPEPLDAPPAPSLAALRDAGAQRLDPLRFRYLEALSRRLPAAPAGARPILEARLAAALADYGARFAQAQQAAGDSPRQPGAPAAGQRACAPLAELNHYLRSLAQDGAGGPLGSELDAESEMRSLRRFRETWARITAEDQVDQAVERGPENAGPLNSHRLVLRALGMMRELSPDYLRRFLSQLDTLLWLDQASQKHKPTEARPARRGRAKK